MSGAAGRVDGLKIARGGKGPPMLLLHGGSGPLDGAPFCAGLRERFEVIAPTHPGFAGSPLCDDLDTVDDLSYLYLDLLDSLDVEDVVLLGFSLGGWLAAEIAVKSTARIAKLILVDAVGIKVGDRETRDIADVFVVSQDELNRLLFHDPSAAPDPAAMTADEQIAHAHNRQAVALYAWEPYMHNPKLKGRLHRIDVPTLLIWGESDGIVPPAYGSAYRDLIPQAEMVVIPEAGHAPQFEQPEAFVRHVLAFAG